MAISEMRRAFVPDLDPAVAAACGELWWPRERLAEAVEELARRSGLRRGVAPEPLSPPPAGELDGWMTWAAARLELEAEAVDAAYPEADEMLQGAGPAILLHDEVRGEGFFVVLGARGDRVRLLSPELTVRSLDRDTLRTALCWRLEAPLIPDVEATLDMASTAPRRRAAVRAALLRERLAEARVGGVWMLRLPATGGFWGQLQAAGAVRRFGLVLAVFALVYALEAWSWGLIGGGVLNGRLDFGWLIAWLMVVVTMTPWRLAGAWLEGTATVDTSRIVKSRLLAGALRMSLDGVARQGVGQLLGRVMEAQALESLTLGGGMAVLVAGLEMVFAGWVLSKGVAPLAQISSLIACLVLILALSWRYHRRLAAWSQSRLDMTNTLIEGMVGHRTRLAQERPGRREAAEDAELQGYLEASRRMDDAGAVVLAGLPSAWMMLGLAGLVPAFVGGGAPSAAAMAISLGGLMIAQRSLSGMAGGLAALSRAVAAWDHAGPLFRAGRAGPETRPFTPVGESSFGGGPLLEAQGLTFRYPDGAEPAVRAADLTIQPDDRILLEGGSGGGKSTLAALVTGLREPDSGLMLLGGLDRHTLGDGWRRMAAYAPQFHDNHVLSGPLAFNLLMGRAWPPSAEDLAEAEAVCEDLGLGALLRRMPAGVMQPVGETGWQLSHGERSRIFLARALLQGAPLTAMDESFGALDPETMALCLRATLRRTRALMVVAHP